MTLLFGCSVTFLEIENLQIYAHTFQAAQTHTTDNPQCNQHKKTSENRTSPNNGQTTVNTKNHKKQLRQRRNYDVCGVMFGAADRT